MSLFLFRKKTPPVIPTLSANDSLIDEGDTQFRQPTAHSSGLKRGLSDSLIYQFKVDSLDITSKFLAGRNLDIELIKRLNLHIQSQLFHAVFNDHSISEEARRQLLDYHTRSVRATIADRREARNRAA